MKYYLTDGKAYGLTRRNNMLISVYIREFTRFPDNGGLPARIQRHWSEWHE